MGLKWIAGTPPRNNTQVTVTSMWKRPNQATTPQKLLTTGDLKEGSISSEPDTPLSQDTSSSKSSSNATAIMANTKPDEESSHDVSTNASVSTFNTNCLSEFPSLAAPTGLPPNNFGLVSPKNCSLPTKPSPKSKPREIALLPGTDPKTAGVNEGLFGISLVGSITPTVTVNKGDLGTPGVVRKTVTPNLPSFLSSQESNKKGPQVQYNPTFCPGSSNSGSSQRHQKQAGLDKPIILKKKGYTSVYSSI
jgi:hypothetical protein